MTDDDPAAEFRAVWQRRRKSPLGGERGIAAGNGRHWNPERPRVRTQSRALRKFARERARLDVLCGRRMIARVLEREDWAGLELVMEMIGSSAGRLSSGHVSTVLPLGVGPFVVACRCPSRTHTLDPDALARAAARHRPGRAGEVGVAQVEDRGLSK